MKKIVTLAIAITLVLLQIACRISGLNIDTRNVIQGSGKVVEEVRPLKSVNQVTLATLGNLQIKIGEEESLVIRADENIISEIRSDVDPQGMLTIEIAPNVGINPISEISYVLTVKALKGIHLTSLGSAEAGTLKGADFALSVLGSGSLKIEELDVDGPVELTLASLGNATIDRLSATKLLAEVNSSGTANISGEVDQAEISVSSLGSFEGSALQIQSSEPAQVKLTTSGSGSIRTGDILATKGVSLEATSLGNIDTGTIETAELSTTISGSGSVNIDGGNADRIDAHLSSLGSFDARKLNCQAADITISGSGSAHLTVEKLINARLSSLGSLFYRGNPTLDVEVSGTGEVKSDQ